MQRVIAVRGDGVDPSSRIPTCAKPGRWPSYALPAPKTSNPRAAAANWGAGGVWEALPGWCGQPGLWWCPRRGRLLVQTQRQEIPYKSE